MLTACLALIVVGFSLGLPFTLAARALGRRMGALDGPGVAGQVKAATRRVPNTGGIAIFLSIALPLAGGVALLNTPAVAWAVGLVPDLEALLPRIRQQTTPALTLLTALAVLHVVGVRDDRRPLGPFFKLAVMLAVATLAVVATGSRLLTLLDPHIGGPWLSILLTVLWLAVVTNALNFMDNMDGLSAGVAAIAAACFMAAAVIHRQWLVAACLGLLIGALLAFLCFNFPRNRAGGASIFMGDGGSLVVGFLLGFLTIRTTYYDPGAPTIASPDGVAGTVTHPGAWYGVLMPLMVLAVPLYDFLSVTILRLRQGRSPFVGDLQHLSHRLTRRGLSRRAAVLVIYGLTAITALGGVSLGSLAPWQALVAGAQTLLVLVVLAVYEGRAGLPPVPDPAPHGGHHR
jgi:UDP-GlcNAc:undecaprenyl-phosphate GlcNAc-1-phosphate transferase